MSLENKQSGDKQFAFEVNGTMRAIRTLFCNVLDLIGIAWEKDLGTLNSTTQNSSVTVPNGAKFCVVNVVCGSASGESSGSDIFLDRFNKKTSVYKSWSDVANAQYVISFTWSGNIISWINSNTPNDFNLDFYFY